MFLFRTAVLINTIELWYHIFLATLLNFKRVKEIGRDNSFFRKNRIEEVWGRFAEA